MSSEPGRSRELQRRAEDLAEELRGDCATLEESLAQMQRTPPDEVEKDLERHLERIGPVCQRIEAAAEALSEVRRHLHESGCEPGEQVLADLSDCRRLLTGAAGTYGELADVVAEVMSGVRERLKTLRRGGKTLRSYRRGTGLAG
ncbi:MAG: hypothetical protein R6X33_02845 [Candidatus Brocadiia bacterium]